MAIKENKGGVIQTMAGFWACWWSKTRICQKQIPILFGWWF